MNDRGTCCRSADPSSLRDFLMHSSSSTISRAIAAVLAIVHLVVLPATYVLHDCADCCSPRLSDRAQCCDSGCCAARHKVPASENQTGDDQPERNGPRDSDECQVCQTVFAPAVATVGPVLPEHFRMLAILRPTVAEAPSFEVLYRELSRGPPTAAL